VVNRCYLAYVPSYVLVDLLKVFFMGNRWFKRPLTSFVPVNWDSRFGIFGAVIAHFAPFLSVFHH
jgi:hypothetical protein